MAKKNTTKQNLFSKALCDAIAYACSDRCADGSTAASEEVAEALLKSRQFTETKLEVMTALVKAAVRDGEVPNHAIRRGRNGGIYMVELPPQPAAEPAEVAPAAE